MTAQSGMAIVMAMIGERMILPQFCGSGRDLGEQYRDRPATNRGLILILLFSVGAAGMRIWQKLG